MKKIVSFLLVFVLCMSNLSFLATAQGTAGEYSDAEKESIYLRYTNNENLLESIFGNDTDVGYWRLANETKEKGFFKWLLDSASWIIGEYPDKQKYAEILANLITMQSGNIAEQIQNQSQYDDLKDGMEYTMDIVGITSDFIGGADILNDISSIIDAATDGVDVIIDNVEQAKYFETTIKDYSQSKQFLEAISNYAENEELRATASSLLKANDKLLESRLEYLTDSTTTLAEYEAEFFVKNMSFELLKTADLYKTDETVKWYVDCGDKLSKSIQSIFSGAKFAFKMTMLAGDIGFGTSDTFNRYQEMEVVSEIAAALAEANRNVQIPSRYDSPEALNIIQTKCDYYKMLIVTHARGEYLLYQLLINDAGALSDITALFDAFKEPGETTKGWYDRQISVMLKYYDTLSNMFLVEEDKDSTTTDQEGIPQDAVEFNGHYYYAYNIDTITDWNMAQEYCEAQGGYLATITSPEEDRFLYSYITDAGYDSVMFGLTDQDQTDDWRWVTGEDASYQNWSPGEPNHQGGYEHYGMYYEKNPDGTWNDGSGLGGPFLCEWGEYSTTAPLSETHYDTDRAFGKYLTATAKTTQSGSWSEQLILEADMSIAYNSGKTKTKVTLTADSDVSNYIKDDLSQIRITSLANMKIMGQTYSWTTEYYDGVAHYEYTEPFQRTESLEIAPDFFDFETSIPEDAILSENISGDQIQFVVSGKKMTENGIAAVQQMSGIDDMECEDVEVIVTLNDSGSIQQIVMNFDASVKYQGYDADVTYKIQYIFKQNI